MIMSKEQYINDKINKLTQYWSNLAAFFGGFFFAGLSLLDYIATPENFANFLKYRLIGVFLFAVIFFLNRIKVGKRYQLSIIYFGVIVSACIIEYMIMHFGEHASPYYAGLFILIMVIVGFVPIPLYHSIYLSMITFLIYLVPILIYDESLSFKAFSVPLFFLVSTFAIANVWRYLSQKSLVNELSLQYNLEQQTKQLASYSSQLQSMVEERTKSPRIRTMASIAF